MPKVRKHLTYANVVASLSLFLVVSGGVTYAATHLPRNSVGTKQLKARSVTGAKVKDRSLTGADINVSTLDQVPSAKKAAPAGPAGGALSGDYPNPQIATGAITPTMLASGIPRGVHVVKASEGGTTSEPRRDAEVRCPQGERAIGGGAFAPTFGATGFVALVSSGPFVIGVNNLESIGWSATAIEVNGGSTERWGMDVYVICAQL